MAEANSNPRLSLEDFGLLGPDADPDMSARYSNYRHRAAETGIKARKPNTLRRFGNAALAWTTGIAIGVGGIAYVAHFAAKPGHDQVAANQALHDANSARANGDFRSLGTGINKLPQLISTELVHSGQAPTSPTPTETSTAPRQP